MRFGGSAVTGSATAGNDAALVGREEELARLRELVAAPYAESRALLLLGESGMGKTLLATQLAVVSQFTSMIAEAASDPAVADRTWVLLTEAVPGGWGLSGHANTNEELVTAARKQIAELQAQAGGAAPQ